MKAAPWLLLLTAIALVACNKSAEQNLPPAAAAPSEPSPAAAPPNTVQAPPAAEPEQQQKLDASKAKAFVAYQEKLIEWAKDWVKSQHELSQNQADGKYKGALGTIKGIADVNAKLAPKAEQEAVLRKENGLSEEDLTALRDIQAHVYMVASGIGTQIAAQIETLQKAVAAASPADRPAAEQSLAELKATGAQLMSMKDMREKYGDAIVDAMTAQQADLMRQTKELSDIK